MNAPRNIINTVSESPKLVEKIVLVTNLLKSQKDFIDSTFEKIKICISIDNRLYKLYLFSFQEELANSK